MRLLISSPAIYPITLPNLLVVRVSHARTLLCRTVAHSPTSPKRFASLSFLIFISKFPPSSSLFSALAATSIFALFATTPPDAIGNTHAQGIMAAATTLSPTVSETLLREAAEHSLRAFIEPNAIFLAERLHAAYPSPASRNLLATAHIQQGNYSQAADVLSPANTPENRYLYAVCQVRMNTPTSLRDAEAHLRGPHGPIDVDVPAPQTAPGAAAGLYLLATICHRTGRKDEAVTLYRRAVDVNPMLWVAFYPLAAMGVVSHADSIIPPISDALALDHLHAQPCFTPGVIASARAPSALHSSDALHRSASAHAGGAPPMSSNRMLRRQDSAHRPSARTSLATTGLATLPRGNDVDETLYETPSPFPSRLSARAFGDSVTTPVNTLQPNSGRHLQTPRRMPRRSISPGSLHALRIGGRRGRNIQFDDNSSVRNPVDLFTTTPLPRVTSNLVASTPPLMASRGSFTPPVDCAALDGGKVGISRIGLAENDGPPQKAIPVDGSHAITILRALGQIAAELGRFRCIRAIELSNNLPIAHKRTGFVLSMRGRAYLERGDYHEAEKEFAKSLQLEPSRVEGIAEYYSTVLWQLKKEKELASLAIRVQKVHPVSTAAWCAAGNCFSLQRDADTALQYFRRAIATARSPTAYAHTLCGHEHLGKEDFDAALASYREALHIDDRHYNAMYGIGQVLLKQEKYALAQSHFRNAVQINPRNSNLHYHLGVALAAGVNNVVSNSGEENSRGNRHALVSALAELETAGNLDSTNPVPRFERAKILATMQRFGDARQQLEDLRDSLPKEAEVHFELSRVCHRLGDNKSALQSLSVALDIEPKERRYKKALELLSKELESGRGDMWQ